MLNAGVPLDLKEMWSQLCADANLYAALRYPQGARGARKVLIWLISPGLIVLAAYRARHALVLYRQRKGHTLMAMALKVPLTIARQLLIILFKVDVRAATIIEGGVYLSDRGQLILGPERIGSGTMIHERVTIGVKAGEDKAPVIAENVWIGPDCLLYGDISIGAGVTVLPGTVMSMDVPAGAVVGGNPAIIVRRNFDNRYLRQTLSCSVDPHLAVER